MSAKDRKEDKNHPPRQGSVSTADNETQTWLHSFWHRKEAPERLEVWLLTGPQRDIRTKLIFHQDFKANEDKNPEECAYIANVILATAQHDCTTTQRRSWYEIAVIDRHRSPHPVVRRFGPLNPMSAEMVKKGPDGAHLSEDEEEMMIGAKPMILQYLDRLIATVERKDQAITAITGDLLLHQSRENAELRADRNRAQEREMQMFFAIQDALDRKDDRELRRKERMVEMARDELIADGMREAGRLVRNMLPGVVDSFTEKQQPPGQSAPPQRVTMQPAKPGEPPSLPDYGPSRERYLVENFLKDIASVKNEDGQPANLEERLLGDWLEDEETGTMKPNPDPTRAGIFTPDQVRVLIGVAKGWIAPDRVDELMPEFGHQNAITTEQLAQFQGLNVPQSVQMAVFELMGLRAKKRQAAATSTNTPA